MKPTQELIEEHDAILKMFSILDELTQKELDFIELPKIVEFFQVFADKCHHGKEEDLLFPEMLNSGTNQNDIDLLINQHNIGRGFVKEMAAAAAEKNGDKFKENFSEYEKLLRAHIDIENSNTFPQADNIISPEKQIELTQKFETVEKEIIGEGKHEEFHALIDRLEQEA